MELVLDGRLLTSREMVHEFFSEGLEFPSYYGRNLDALYDQLSEIRHPLTVKVCHLTELRKNLGNYADTLLDTLRDAIRKNPVLTLELQRKVGISCCSNPHKREVQEENEKLRLILEKAGYEPDFTEALYFDADGHYPTGRVRAGELMRFYRDERITDIFDISGGDMANETLSYLDFDLIGKSGKWFWGYSDLSTVINAIYTATGNKSVLYMVKNIFRDESGKQLSDFLQSTNTKKGPLFEFEYRFLQGESCEGIVVGGNIRCLLKLAGTPYFPDMRGKILFLESLGGEVPQMVTYLSQYKMLGVFDQIAGIVLGTYSVMEGNGCSPTIEELVLSFVGEDMPVVKTDFVGHHRNSKALIIGEHYSFRKNANNT